MIWWLLGGGAFLFIAYEVIRVEHFIHVYRKGDDYAKTVRVLEHQERLDRAIDHVDSL